MRRIFHYSLRTLLLVAVSFGVLAACFNLFFLMRYRAEAELRNRFAALGGEVNIEPRDPVWFWSLFGDGIAARTRTLLLEDTPVGDAELPAIGKLTALTGLYLNRTQITDDGLEHLRDLTNLKGLSLRRTQITRAPPIEGMANLIDLDLSFTNVQQVDTTGLKSLRFLTLRGTKIGDDMLAALSALPNLETLDIAGAPGNHMSISDRGLEFLTPAKFPKLSTLYVYESDVTLEGLRRFMTRFPTMSVFQDTKTSAEIRDSLERGSP